MELLPAIDLRGRRCVRLRQGAFGAETVYDDDPVAVASRFADEGARWIHVVDLDAAGGSSPLNRSVIAAIAASVPDVAIEAAGGVRTVEAACELWEAGVTRVVVGTAAVERPELVGQLVAKGRVAVGVDHRAGKVAVRGWTADTGVDVATVTDRAAAEGAEVVIVTDISRDGMLAGPDVEGLRAAVRWAAGRIGVVASGGVSSVEDLAALRAIDVDGAGLAGVIVGKAIYERRLSVAEGLAACGA